MVTSEIVEIVKTMAGEDDETILSAYVNLAKSFVLQRLYPFGGACDDVPDKYSANWIEISVYLLNKRGAEGETSHNEGGVSRQYGGAGVPMDMLKSIIPFCGAMEGGECYEGT